MYLSQLKSKFPLKTPELAIDHLVIGGGVVGLAVASRLCQKFPHKSTYLIERHERAGEETSSRNSEVIHGGLYYPKDSLKTKLCIRGRKLLYERCKQYNIDHKKTGKLVVATSNSQFEYLRKLHAHTQSSEVNVPTHFISTNEALDMEPDLSHSTTGAILSPETGIIDSHGLMDSFEKDISESENCELVYGTDVVRIDTHNLNNNMRRSEGDDRGYVIQTLTKGSVEPDALLARSVINCAGLNAHTMLNMTLPVDLQRKLWYTKGNWFQYKGDGVKNVKHLLYPCPEPSLAGLGTHLTMTLDGSIKFGPDIEHLEHSDEIDYWQRYLRPSESNLEKIYEAVKTYLPHVQKDGFAPDQAGIRVKVNDPTSGIFNDFEIIHDYLNHPGMISLLGIESPGLTACMGISEEIESILKSQVWGSGRGNKISEVGNSSLKDWE